MTYIEQEEWSGSAIKEAVEKGGYVYHGDKPIFDDQRDQWFVSDGDGGYDIPALSEFFLDPLFWQALGKARKWDKIETNPKNVSWLEWWHRFIDHLAGGKDAESFFETL